MLHLTVASAALKNRANSIEKPLDLNETRSNDAGRPGLSFSSTGRLDNRAAGFFEVLDVTYAGGNSGEVTSFSADFTHYGEERASSFSIVEFRFNATAVPEPSSAGVLFLATSALVLFRKRR
jgi:hypothetical protein